MKRPNYEWTARKEVLAAAYLLINHPPRCIEDPFTDAVLDSASKVIENARLIAAPIHRLERTKQRVLHS